MKNQKVTAKVVNAVIKNSLKGSANSTTCYNIYQPKAPASLKKFSKISDDK